MAKKGSSWIGIILGVLVAVTPWLFGDATRIIETILGIVIIVKVIMMMK